MTLLRRLSALGFLAVLANTVACVAEGDGDGADDNVASGVSVPGTVAASRAAGLYREPVPNNQDAQNNAVAGLGGPYVDAMPAFVFSPRRQTDQMVRQAYELLPPDLKRDVAFVHAQRVAQDPEGAAQYLAGKKQVVIVGSLKGVNSATADDPKVTAVHNKELKALEITLAMARGLGLPVRDVVYGMGDSSPARVAGRFVPNAFAVQKRTELEGRMRGLLTSANYLREERLSWGADELMLCAFAAQLPDQTISTDLESPTSRYFYDSDATTKELVEEAARKSALTVVSGAADLHLHAFSLLPAANTAGDQTFPDAGELAAQRSADEAFAAKLRQRAAGGLSRTVIVDARLNNGALDTASLPPTVDVLGFSAWGTGGNNFGQALAMAKIVASAENRAKASGNAAELRRVSAARTQLAVEAIAHDVFFIGYASGASGASVGDGRANALSSWLRGHALPVAPGQSLAESQLIGFYREASRYATAALTAKYAGLAGQVRFVPQPFNRRFEASTLYSEGPLAQAGSLSSELVAKYPDMRPGATYRDYTPKAPGASAVGSNGTFTGP